MFGATQGGWIGGDRFAPQLKEGLPTAFFLFQLMFAGAATTIVSGAVAERMKFAGYLIVAAVLSGLIYTVFGHWVWNGLDPVTDSGSGWLYKLGFRDFAGVTVVHGVGGWVALAAVLVIGSRRGRFTDDGKSREISGHDLPMAMLGAMLLMLGWFGFNGGSEFKLSSNTPSIIVNTVIAGAAGTVIALLLGWKTRQMPNALLAVNGMLAGLVSITGCCNAVDARLAVVIGAIGGIVMLLVVRLLERLRIDDAIGAVPVHAAAGVWGAIAVALFADPNVLNTGLPFFAQLGVQLLGVVVCFLWSFGIGFVLLKTINHFYPLRVSVAWKLKSNSES